MGISKERNVDINEGWNIITKNKTECNVGKYFEHLKEPDLTDDISQMIYSKAKKLEKGQGQTEVNLGSFAPTMRAEHHGNIEFRRNCQYANVQGKTCQILEIVFRAKIVACRVSAEGIVDVDVKP